MEIPQRCDIASGLDVSGKSDLPNLIYLAYLHFNGSLPERVIVSSRWTAMVLLSRLRSSAHLSVFITVLPHSVPAHVRPTHLKGQCQHFKRWSIWNFGDLRDVRHAVLIVC